MYSINLQTSSNWFSTKRNPAANDFSDLGEFLQLSSRAHHSRSTPNNSDPPPFISSLKLNRADSATMKLLQKAEQVRAIHHHLKHQDSFTHLPRKPVQVLPKLFLKKALTENMNFHHPRISSDRQPTPTNCIKVYKNYMPGQQDPVVPISELRSRSRQNRSREISTRGGDIDHLNQTNSRSHHEKSRTIEFPSMTADNNSFQLNNSISTPARKYRNRMHTVNHIFVNSILKPTNKTLENEDVRCQTSEIKTQNQFFTPNEQEGLNEVFTSYRSHRHSSRTPSLLVLPPHLTNSSRAFSPEQQDNNAANLPVNRKSTTPLRSSRISLTTIQTQLGTPGRMPAENLNLPLKRVQSEIQFAGEQPEKRSKTIVPSNDPNYVNIMSLLKSQQNIGSRHAHSGSLSINNNGKSIVMSIEDLGQKEMKKQVSLSHTRQISEVNLNRKQIDAVSSPDIDGMKRSIRNKPRLKFRNQEAVVDKLFNSMNKDKRE